jgi:hypothetical protein
MANTVKIDVPNYSNLLQKALDSTIQEVGFNIVAEAQRTAPVDTGNYKNQIIFDGKNKVIANADYSAALEYGVRPRIIRATNAKVLHFTVNGKDVFTKYVNQKARPPRSIMRNAARKTQKQVSAIFKKNFERAS